MKPQHYLIALGLLILSCQENNNEPTIKNIDHLQDLVLEITDRNSVGSGESIIFNAYLYGVRLNSDGTFEQLDDGYGGLDYWVNHSNSLEFLWSLEDNQITFYDHGREAGEWTILTINENQLKVQEITLQDNIISQHIIEVSEKQEVR